MIVASHPALPARASSTAQAVTSQPLRRRRRPPELSGLGDLTLPGIPSPSSSPGTWVALAAGAALFAGFFLRPRYDTARRRASRRLAQSTNPTWQTYALAVGAAGAAYYMAKAVQGTSA